MEKEKEMELSLILHWRAANKQQLSLCICKHDLSANVLEYQKRLAGTIKTPGK